MARACLQHRATSSPIPMRPKLAMAAWGQNHGPVESARGANPADPEHPASDGALAVKKMSQKETSSLQKAEFSRQNPHSEAAHILHSLRATMAQALSLSTSTVSGLATYRRREPEKSPLYHCIQNHMNTFVRRIEADGSSLPGFVKDEFTKYLSCGLLSEGFVRVLCNACKHQHLVALSCKGRGWCHSCGGRMAEKAAHLVDNVLPNVPVRQFVLTVPKPIRYLIAYRRQALLATLARYDRFNFPLAAT